LDHTIFKPTRPLVLEETLHCVVSGPVLVHVKGFVDIAKLALEFVWGTKIHLWGLVDERIDAGTESLNIISLILLSASFSSGGPLHKKGLGQSWDWHGVA